MKSIAGTVRHRHPSLLNLLIGAIIALLLLFSLGIFTIQVLQARDALVDRQRGEINNLAQSLSLSLVPAVRQGDWTSARVLLQSVCDGGAVSRIRLESADGEHSVLVEHARPAAAPGWFRSLVPISQISARRMLAGGWMQMGEVRVEADEGLAYAQLWELTRQLLLWMLLGMGVAIVIAVVCLRQLLAPLSRLAARLEEMQLQGFETSLTTSRFRELNGITGAVNRLGSRLNAQFEAQAEQVVRLQRLAERDEVSRLGNRAYLVRAMDDWLAAPVGGSAMIIRIHQLEVIYREEGFAARDTAIRAIGDYLAGVRIDEEALMAARLSAHEFALILPDLTEQARDRQVEEILDRIDDIVDANPLALERIHHARAGVVPREPGLGRMTLLSAADNALREADEQGRRWIVTQRVSALDERGRNEWRQVIETALAQRHYHFVAQSVVMNDGSEFHQEVYIRLDESGQEHLASAFMPVARQFRIADRVDQCVLDWLAGWPRLPEYRLALNLSMDTLTGEESLTHVIQWLEQRPRWAALLDLEVNGEVVVRHRERVEQLFRSVRRLGTRVGIDRFGRNLQAMPSLIRLRPDYIKIDQTFFVRDNVNAEFLHSLCIAVHQLDTRVIVTRVESEEHRERIVELGADGFQGYLTPSQPLLPGGRDS
ncbi:diguanylate cyclase/phosphodiesterase [Kushneria sinocarnis]|uniref:Diguanylate cyclase/phosphodiesterase n=1 Tax=Kushneria sinocarnis TaxID=595502 RepID=A0A420X038_9GAMM|nr:EAL domain-containing protein [Kushneria sinocarnis]RKR06870.1 diguanylate cyclase/phosphodiesterase [Kushneria sinocarnis]